MGRAGLGPVAGRPLHVGGSLGALAAGLQSHRTSRVGEVTGFTVSQDQVQLGREACEGLPIDIRLADYREAPGSYDAVVSF